MAWRWQATRLLDAASPGVRGRERGQPCLAPALRLRAQRPTLLRASSPPPRPQPVDPGGSESRGLARPDDRGRGHQQRGVPDLSGALSLSGVTTRPSRDHGQPLRPQKRGGAREIEACGCCLWFLPAYSPDFNPIEHAFSRLFSGSEVWTLSLLLLLCSLRKSAQSADNSFPCRHFCRRSFDGGLHHTAGEAACPTIYTSHANPASGRRSGTSPRPSTRC